MSRRNFSAPIKRKIAQWYREREENAAGAEAARPLEVRRTTRMRLYECEACRKKIRVADDYLTAVHVHVDPDTLEESLFPFILQTPIMQPVAPF